MLLCNFAKISPIFQPISEAIPDHNYLNHWLLPSLSVELELQLPHSVLSFPQLLSSPPFTLLTLSLQLGQLLAALL